MPRGYGITPHGIRAWIRVSSKADEFDELRVKRFAPGTSPKDIKAWRSKTRDSLKMQLEQRRQQRARELGTAGTFAADAVAYLNAVAALPTFETRKRDIQLWVDEFGPRRRDEIAPHEIRAVRDRWLTVGPVRRMKKVNGVGQWVSVPGPLAASTVNHRLRALSNLYTVLDGRHTRNPVREVPEVNEPQAVPRDLNYEEIRLALAAMSDQGLAEKGKERKDYSLAKVRARCIAWSGITPGELARITKPDNRHGEGFVVVPPRRKGRGAAGRIVPLSADGVEAFADLDRLSAYGRFSVRAVFRAWQLGCRAALGRTVRLYDLRHSYVTAVVRATKSLETAQRLAGHTDPRTTRRYAVSALLSTLRAGVDATFPDKDKPQ